MTQNRPSRKSAPKRSTASKSTSARAKSTGALDSGFKVQIMYRAPKVPTQRSPREDALWFANYPIIPRVGDCLFRDGVYYRVERVYLYENTMPGWCADLEVSYFGRQ
ncbi:MAG: hypothetical protein AAGF66_11170 [Cyanobacteria bacterium P01_H01_bin.119]